MDYILFVAIIILLGISIWLFYLSRVQYYNINHKIKRHQLKTEFDLILNTGDEFQLQGALIKLAFENFKSPEKEKKFQALETIHQLGMQTSQGNRNIIYFIRIPRSLLRGWS